MPKLLLRVNETAERLSLGRSKAYQLIARGDIPSVRIDGVIRVPVSGLEDYVERLQSVSMVEDDDPRRANTEL